MGKLLAGLDLGEASKKWHGEGVREWQSSPGPSVFPNGGIW